MNKNDNLTAVMGEVKSREEVLEKIKRDPGTYLKFKKLAQRCINIEVISARSLRQRKAFE